MYNMDLRRLKELKRIDGDRSLLDFMTKLELAANLFRLRETEARIRNGRIQGQRNLEAIAEQVGRTVRNTMIEISGDRPEDLRVSEDLRLVRSNLRKTSRQFDRLDTFSKSDDLPYPGPSEKYDDASRHDWTSDHRSRAS
jgi:DNA-damage-inducible protein D